ncbi:MAG: hypothetical protein BECKG1743F_GA0114225_102142 [Candidatus Kentron sp. G]|nr:MAG: hypothetical protein BECKG1743F_GA0114225_102142 [Candidatus Kentron sp. G]VFM99003.1 MAG: hypothetical protein BECKG1743E_GA0114224_102232 [Candidatus Kentron sp. G]
MSDHLSEVVSELKRSCTSRTIPELTTRVIAPCPNRAICLESKGMIRPRSKSRDIGEIGDLGRSVFVTVRTIPELTRPIIAPPPKRAVVFTSNGIITPCYECSDISETGDLGRYTFASSGAIPELALSVIAPRPDRTIIFECEGMAIPSVNSRGNIFYGSRVCQGNRMIISQIGNNIKTIDISTLLSNNSER